MCGTTSAATCSTRSSLSNPGVRLTRRQVMLAMLTRDARIVRQDCLCYLMERIHPDSRRRAPESATTLWAAR